MAQKKDVKYKLMYFDGRGRGQLIRYLFTVVGKEFEDFKVPSLEEWPKYKPETPFGQIPVLYVDGKPLAQSRAIARYLAREFKLAGKDSWEQALVDQYMCLVDDMFKEVVKEIFETDEKAKAEIKKNNFEVIFPRFLGFYEKELKKNGGKFFVGGKLSAADLAVLDLFDTPVQMYPNLMDKYPLLKAHRQSISTIPALKAHIENRKVTFI